MQVSSSFCALFSVIFFSNFVPSAYGQSLDEALRTHNLTLLADFFKAYPPDPVLINRPELIVFAPTNDAMQQFFDTHGITVNNGIPEQLLRRDDSDKTAQANALLAQGQLLNLPQVLFSGGGGTEDSKVVEANPNLQLPTTATTETATGPRTTTTATLTSLHTLSLNMTTTRSTNTIKDLQATNTVITEATGTITTLDITSTATLSPTSTVVAKRGLEFPVCTCALEERPPPVSWLAKIYSGNGHLSYIVEDKILFDGGVFYTMDSFFELATNFTSSISKSGFSALESTLNRTPDALALLQNSKRVTFLAPCPEAFAAAQNQLSALSDIQLQSLLDYHTLISGFIGYTPTFQNGRTYKTKSGLSFVVTFKGDDIYINDAKIIARNHILKNGVIQVLDKFLVPPAPGATEVPGPDGLVPISKNTTEDDDPMNPNPQDGSVTSTFRPVPTYAGGDVRISPEASFVAICLAIISYYII